MTVVAEEKSTAADKRSLPNATMRVISKVLETRFLYELMPRHNVWQAKDPSWQRSNPVSATTAVLRAAEQYSIKRSSRHLCEYKCTTKRHPA